MPKRETVCYKRVSFDLPTWSIDEITWRSARYHCYSAVAYNGEPRFSVPAIHPYDWQTSLVIIFAARGLSM